MSRYPALFLSVFLLAACSSAEEPAGSGATSGASSDGGAGVEAGSIAQGGACTNAAQCQASLICDPLSSTCQPASSTPCVSSPDCGAGAVCAGGTCQANASGGLCDVDARCILGEVCIGGRCGAAGSEGDDCTRVEDCLVGLVCNPNNNACDRNLGCTNASDCGLGSICNASGACERNVQDGACTQNEDCLLGQTCIGAVCVDGCGGSLFAAEAVPPNMILALDRSGSMNSAPTPGADSKWNIARAATNRLITAYDGQIRFGLSLFPGINQSCSQGRRCEAGMVNVAVSPTSQANIASFLSGAGTCRLSTPISQELDMLRNDDGLADATRSNYVVLLTDGQHNCSGNPVAAVTALRNANPEVKTFVVGFGGGVSPRQLNEMAEAGGTARPGSTKYYQADNAAALEAAFDDIAGQALSCTYALAEVPPDPDLLFVYFDGVEVARDMSQTDGWDYSAGANQITFYGPKCNQLRNGDVDELVVVYGCPLPITGGDGGVGDGGSGSDEGGVIDPGGGSDAGTGCQSCAECGSQACLFPPGGGAGTCGPCVSNTDCCPGNICGTNGQCRPNI